MKCEETEPIQYECEVSGDYRAAALVGVGVEGSPHRGHWVCGLWVKAYNWRANCYLINYSTREIQCVRHSIVPINKNINSPRRHGKHTAGTCTATRAKREEKNTRHTICKHIHLQLHLHSAIQTSLALCSLVPKFHPPGPRGSRPGGGLLRHSGDLLRGGSGLQGSQAGRPPRRTDASSAYNSCRKRSFGSSHPRNDRTRTARYDRIPARHPSSHQTPAPMWDVAENNSAGTREEGLLMGLLPREIGSW